jgi:MscS family membrane protein
VRFFASLFVLIGLLTAIPERTSAQLPLPERETAIEAADQFGRETPRSTVAGLIRALADQDYVLAGNYFALDDDDPERAARLAMTFQASLDAGGNLISFDRLSNNPEGRLRDQLSPNLERIGTFSGPEEVPILLSRTTAEASEGGDTGASAAQPPIWRMSEETIAELEQRAGAYAEAERSNNLLIGGAPFADWVILAGLLAVTFALFWLLSWLILAALRGLLTEPEKNSLYRFLYAALPPLSLLLAVIVFRVWGSDTPVAIVARQTVLRYIGILAWVALAWFTIRLVDAIATQVTSKLDARSRRQAASAVTLARRAIKLLLVAVATIAILDTLDVSITTGVAALGIGGLALALGAQRTIENLVGSVTVVADRPIQVGDFCKVGDVLGTVEDIGMRSTRIRTNDRTIVTIPNGDFSSRQIENYSQRDRFLFNPIIGLEYGISATQLRKGIAIIEGILAEHPLVAENPCRAKLGNFGPSSLDVEIFAYIGVPDFAESLNVRHELLLSIFERLEEAGLAIAFPSQTLYLRPDGDIPTTKISGHELNGPGAA